jgi:hypothetical protein
MGGNVRRGIASRIAIASNNWALATGLALALSGCLLPKYEREAEYDPVQAAVIHAEGKAEISGQAFLQKSSGAVVYAAGREVILYPGSDYIAEQMRLVYGDKKFLSYYGTGREFDRTDPRFLEDRRVTKANAQGRFSFDKIAPGKYFVETSVIWRSRDLVGGGLVYESVEVAGEEKVEIIVSGH